MPRTQFRTDNYADGSITNPKIADGTVIPQDIDQSQTFRFNSIILDSFVESNGISLSGSYTFIDDVVFTGSVGFSGVNVDELQLYSNGIIMNNTNYGLLPQITGAMEITVTGGDAVLNRKVRTYHNTILNITSDPSNDKIGVIYLDINTSTINIKYGVAAVNPNFPTIEETEYVIAYIYINASETNLSTNDIFMQRNPLNIGKKRGRSYGVVGHNATIPLPVAETNTFTTSDIASGDTIINVLTTDDFKNEGYIKIGGEVIQYTSKTKNSFLGCIRGVEGTIADSHNKYTTAFYTFPTTACVFTVSNNFQDIYPVWESTKWVCTVDSNRIVTNYVYAPTWGGVTVYGLSNYEIYGEF